MFAELSALVAEMSEVARSVPTMETTTCEGQARDRERAVTSNQPAAEAALLNSPTRSAQRRLTDQDLAILRFEKRWWRQAAAKEAAARAKFGVSTTRYYQQLNRLLDVPAAQAAEPELVKRLRRARDGDLP